MLGFQEHLSVNLGVDQIGSKTTNPSVKSLIIAQKLTLLLVVILAAAQTRGQGIESLYESWRWTRFTTESGLPSNTIWNLVESPNGRIWAATEKGLAWYDSYEWHAVTSDDGLPEKAAQHLSIAGDRDVLFVVDGELYRGGIDGFHKVDLQWNGRPLLVSSAVANGEMEIIFLGRTDPAAPFELFRYDGVQTLSFDTPADVAECRAPKLWQTRNGATWLTTTTIYKRLGGAWITRLKPELPSYVDALIEDDTESGVLYLCMPNERYSPWEWSRGGTIRRALADEDELHLSTDAPNAEEVLIVYKSGKLRVRSNGTWRILDPIPRELESATFVKYRSNGELFVGTHGGLLLHRRLDQRWTHWRNDRHGATNQVLEIMRANDGSVWLGTRDGVEIRRADGSSEFLTRIGETSLRTITGLAQDNAGNIWLSSGLSFDGAFRFDGSTWVHFGKAQGLAAPLVHRIRKDRLGNLWFLGLGDPWKDPMDGPGAFVLRDERFERWGRAEGLPNGRVYAFAHGQDGSLWFATLGGLSRFREGTWTHWNQRNGLCVDRVFAIALDESARLWFTHELVGGLGYINENDSPEYVPRSAGLSDDHISDIAVGPQNRLWVAAETGVFSLWKGAWTAFTCDHGLPRPNALDVLTSGELVYMGTFGGGTAILDLTRAELHPPKIRFHRTEILDSNATVRWNAMAYEGELAPGEIPTRYSLDGNQWSPWSIRREVELEDLGVGTYTMHVQAKGFFGQFSDQPSLATFDIQRPLYFRAVFVVPVCLVVGTLLTIVFVSFAKRRRQQVSLQESEERFRQIADTVGEVFLLCHAHDGAVIYANPAFERIWGRPREELRSNPHAWHQAIHPADQSGVAIRSNGRSEQIELMNEYRILRPDGTTRWIRDRITPVGANGGRDRRIVRVAEDITERRETQEKLRRSEKDYRSLFENAHDAILVFDPDNEIILAANDRACTIYGFDRSELVGGSLNLFQPEDRRGREMTNQILNRRGYHGVELIHFRKDGRELFIEVRATVVDYNGRKAILSINRDITERRALEEAARRHGKALASTNRLATIGEMASGLAHELNQPLCAIAAYTQACVQMLRNGTVNASKLLETMEKATGQANRAGAIINRMKDFVRKPKPVRSRTDVNDVIRDAAVLVAPAAKKHNVSIELDLTDSLPSVQADAMQIEQVILNLVVNGLEAIDEIERRDPKVIIRSTRTQDCGIQVDVCDNGRGVNDDVRERMFNLFFTTKTEGLGMGLSICRSIIEAHDGKLWATTNVDDGTTFHFSLPTSTGSDGQRGQGRLYS